MAPELALFICEAFSVNEYVPDCSYNCAVFNSYFKWDLDCASDCHSSKLLKLI